MQISPRDEIRIVFIGAGSTSFGRGTIADVIACKELGEHDCTLYLVDTDEEALRKSHAIAELIKEYHGSQVRIQSATERKEALPGADFVIISVARKRYELWEQDYRIPMAYGFRHVLGENGGPGALFHALRNFEVVLPICRDIERLCPEALVLNYTNPESRIVMAMAHLTKVNAVGLCHGVLGTRKKIAQLLGRQLDDLRIVTGGLNHLFWVLKIQDAQSGRDLYPLLRRLAMKTSPPLSKRMLEIFDYYIFPSDDHIGEYLSFAHEFADGLWPYGGESRAVEQSGANTDDWRDDYLSGRREVDEDLVRPSGEIAVDVIADVVGDRGRWEPSVNVVNLGSFVENLPTDAVVEVPAVVDANGIHPESVGSLPEPLAAFCRIQVSIQLLLVEAYRKRSRRLLLQALLLDPVVDSIRRAEEMLDYMLELQKKFLPVFS